MNKSPDSPPSATLTIHDALTTGRRIIASVSRSSALDAQLLLAHILDVDRAYVLAYGERALKPEQADQYRRLVNRAASGEPLAYILGKRAFFDRDFVVTPDVLIPRPETEGMVERALAWIRAHKPDAHAIDVGTGSGAIAISVAANARACEMHASDVSAAALVVARRNAELHDLADRVTFWEGDLLTPVIEQGLRFDVILANLPYIPHEVIAGLDINVRDFEPDVALDGGGDGLDLIRRLLDQIQAAGNPDALVLLEIGADQGAAALELARAIQPTTASLHKDLAGLDRMIEIIL